MLIKKNIIWSNLNLDLNDWRDDLVAENPDLSEDELYKLMYEINDGYLGDERLNLNIQLDEPILVIADIGRWNGRVMGYKVIQSGNISDCLYSDTDYAEWYVDKYGDLRCTAHHHDGINQYLYRVYKSDVSEERRENLLNKIYYGTVTRADITRTTQRLGDYIAKVYGWRIVNQKSLKEAS